MVVCTIKEVPIPPGGGEPVWATLRGVLTGVRMSAEERRLEVYPPIYKLGYVGKWLREHLMKGILSGTPVLLGMQQLRSRWLNVMMSCVSFMGEEEFYTLLVPLVVWVGEVRLGRLLALLMALAFYTCGFLKNLLCLPRPPSPPVIPLHQCQDWSLPSHHAVLSVNLPWYIWFYLHHYHAQQWGQGYMATFLFLLIFLWSFCVMFSRMYLGVHSPADILSGGVVGCLLLAAWLQVDMAVDHFITHSGNSAILLYMAAAVVMLYLHPDPKPTTIIYTETVCLVGVTGGVILSQALIPSVPAVLEATQGWQWSSVWCGVLRYALGMAFLLLVKIVAKIIAQELLTQLCRLVGVTKVVCVKRRSQVTNSRIHYSTHFITLDHPYDKECDVAGGGSDAALDIAVPVRLITYNAMGVVVMAAAPQLFRLLGI